MNIDEVKQLTAPANKRVFKKYYVPINAERGEFQADLMDFSLLSGKKGNVNMTFALVIIEVYSRYGFMYPLKTKSPDDVLKAFQMWNDILDIKKHPVRSIRTDDGSEWKAGVGKWMRDNGILHRVADVKYGKTSMGVVERFNRTIRMILREMWLTNGNLVWTPLCSEVMKRYNHTLHSRMREKPVDVWNGIMPRFRAKIPVKDLVDGDRVRLLVLKKTFDKDSSTANWSTKIYTVIGKHENRYKLSDDNFYPRWALLKIGSKNLTEENTQGTDINSEQKVLKRERRVKQELKREDIKPDNVEPLSRQEQKDNQYIVEKIVASRKDKKQRRRLYLVKWKGYADKDNSWLPAKDIADDMLKAFEDKKTGR